MIGVDLSTLTGSGLMYRQMSGEWGFKASAYGISSSKDKENSFAVGVGMQRNMILKPLTRLYALAGTSFRQQNYDRSTDYTKNYFNFGVGFGIEARALQAVKNEDIIFFFEVGEKYFSIIKLLNQNLVVNPGFRFAAILHHRLRCRVLTFQNRLFIS
jgi:hypothetical protein